VYFWPVRRKLFNLAAAVSLVLCVAVCVLWVRSYFAQDTIAYDFSDDRPGMNDISVASSNGVLAVHHFAHPTALYPPGLRRFVTTPSSMRPTPTWRTFAFDRGEQNGGRFWRVFAPHWSAALLCAVSPALWLSNRRRQRRRVRDRLCPCCGYDLRATPDRCPECGALPDVRPSAGEPVGTT
jgi:hypothetical protein